MTASDAFAVCATLALFGFLAAMAWTGKLVGIDGFKIRLFSWIVEDVGVGNFGRAGATIIFAVIGVLSVPAVLWLRRRVF